MSDRDYIVRATAADEFIRAFAITSRGIAEKARVAHNLTPVATAALGRLLSGAAMMGIMMKGEEESVTVQIKGDGPMGGLVVPLDQLPDAMKKLRGGYGHIFRLFRLVQAKL